MRWIVRRFEEWHTLHGILFGDADRAITGVLPVLVLMGLLLVGKRFQLH